MFSHVFFFALTPCALGLHPANDFCFFVCFVQAYSLHVIHYYHDNNYLIPINLLRLLAGLIIVFRKQCNM